MTSRNQGLPREAEKRDPGNEVEKYAEKENISKLRRHCHVMSQERGKTSLQCPSGGQRCHAKRVFR